MKVKQFVVITRPEEFLRGGLNCFNLFENTDYMGDEWIVVGPVEFDVSVANEEVRKKALLKFDSEILRAEGRIAEFKRRKAELMALPAPK
jgi:hypothetical protein